MNLQKGWLAADTPLYVSYPLQADAAVIVQDLTAVG